MPDTVSRSEVCCMVCKIGNIQNSFFVLCITVEQFWTI